MRTAAFIMLSLSLSLVPARADSQQYPPGTFSIDGIPVQCGPVVFVVDPSLPNIGMAQPGFIILNPYYFFNLPTSLKLFWAAHECGHQVVGINETMADCWAIRTGRQQGWFPPSEFNALVIQLSNVPGGFYHPPGPVRIQNMIACYNSP